MDPEARRYEDDYEGDGEEVVAEEELPLDEEIGEPLHLPMLRPEGPMPRTRGDCLPGGSNAARPCQWITCRWYLPRMTPNPKFTCALDVADSGGVTLEEVGELMGITRERVRQIEEKVMRRIKQRDTAYNKRMLQKLVEDAPGSKGWDYHI
jgi:hypothetical protein